MYSIVSGKERYLKNMPVVGMTPQFYTIPGINSLVQPRVDYQFYNPWTGSIGPSFTNSSNLLNTSNITNTNNLNVDTEIYNRNGLFVGIVGTIEDVRKVKRCLDLHLSHLDKKIGDIDLISELLSSKSSEKNMEEELKKSENIKKIKEAIETADETERNKKLMEAIKLILK